MDRLRSQNEREEEVKEEDKFEDENQNHQSGNVRYFERIIDSIDLIQDQIQN